MANIGFRVYDVQYNVFHALAYHMFDEIIAPSIFDFNNNFSTSFGSEVYYEIEEDTYNDVLLSGRFKLDLSGGLYNYSIPNNMSFNEFVDMIYEDFSMDALFRCFFEDNYKYSYSLVLSLGNTIYETADFGELTIEYLR